MSTEKVTAFYKSKEWRSFRAHLINKRTNEDGLVICAICGKPIIRRYDAIGHHKIELNDDNVDDALVSLNPDNVDIVHLRCHSEVHHKHGEFIPQKVYLVYGPPCSGKTSYVEENANDDDLILDIDRLWGAVCKAGRDHTHGRGKRPKRIANNVFRLRDAMIDMIRTRTGKWRVAWVIGGYPLRSDRDRLCDLLRAEPIYCEATLDECLARCEKERPEEWRDYVLRWFEDFTD